MGELICYLYSVESAVRRECEKEERIYSICYALYAGLSFNHIDIFGRSVCGATMFRLVHFGN